MNILVVSNYFPEHFGGEEIVAFNLVMNFRNMGHKVRWLAGKVQGVEHLYHPDDVGIPICNITESRFGFPYPIINPLYIIVMIKHVQWADIIHIHDSLFLINLLIGGIAKCFGKPIVLTQHISIIPYKENYKIWLQQIGYKIFAKPLLEHSNQVVFVSDVVKEWFTRNFRFDRSAMIIYNGVDPEIFFEPDDDERERIRQSFGIESSQRVILFVGRFTEKKGIKIIKSVIEKTPEFCWILIGRIGEENPFLWPFKNLIVLPPKPQKELRNYYVAADLTVLPSVGEGFPLVIQESMMCGTPALITNETAKAIKDLPVIKVETNDKALFAAIHDVLEDSEALQSLRRIVAKFASDHWKWESSSKLYEQLMINLAKESGYNFK